MLRASFIKICVFAALCSALVVPRANNSTANSTISGIPGLNRTEIYQEVEAAIATLPKDTTLDPHLFSYDSDEVSAPYLLPNFRQGPHCHLVTTIEKGYMNETSSWANVTEQYRQMNDMLSARGGHCVQSIIGAKFLLQLGIECVNVVNNETLVNPDPTAFRAACMML